MEMCDCNETGQKYKNNADSNTGPIEDTSGPKSRSPIYSVFAQHRCNEE